MPVLRQDNTKVVHIRQRFRWNDYRNMHRFLVYRALKIIFFTVVINLRYMASMLN